VITPRFDSALANGVARVTGAALGPYQTAVVRIGFSLTWLLFLLREWPNRLELYGPDGPWNWEMARQLIDGNGAFTVLMWSDGRLWFELVYLLAIVVSALLLVGWRTRTLSVLFMVGVLSLQNRSVFMGDGGDNVVHLMSIYLVLTRCGQVWSIDARRRERARAAAARADRDALESEWDGPEADREPSAEWERERDGAAPERDEVAADAAGGEAVREAAHEAAQEPPGQPRGDAAGVVLWTLLGLALALATLFTDLSTGWALLFWGTWVAQALWWAVCRYAPDGELRSVLDVVANLVHNGALLVIMAEVCLIYATAGWYKVQGSRWQDGTALHYPLHLDYFSPWPALSDALSSSGVMVMLITYGTVIVQVAFPFTLFNRKVKNVLLAVMMTEHLFISVVLGLPFFSLAMIAADAVFLPTGLLRTLGRAAARARDRLPRRRAPGPEAGSTVEAQPHTLVG